MAAACRSAAVTRRELAREFGTPLYAVAEDDLRARAREFTRRDGRRRGRLRLQGLPCTAVLRVFHEEGLSVDVASGGELALAQKAGYAGAGSSSTATPSRRRAARAAADGGARIVVDNFDELDKLERARGARSR